MKRYILILAVLILSASAVLYGCGKKEDARKEFGIETNEDNTVTITAENGAKGSSGTAYIEIKEGEAIILDNARFDDGSIRIEFFEPSDTDRLSPVVSYDVISSGKVEITCDPGKYDILATALSDVSGLFKISSGKLED